MKKEKVKRKNLKGKSKRNKLYFWNEIVVYCKLLAVLKQWAWKKFPQAFLILNFKFLILNFIGGKYENLLAWSFSY